MKLKHLETWTELRRSHAQQYAACFRAKGICHATEISERRHVYHIYSLFNPARNQLQEALQTENIQTGMHYPIPIHLQKAYEDLGLCEGDLPITEQIAKEQLSLPMFAELTHEQINRVAEVVKFWQEKTIVK